MAVVKSDRFAASEIAQRHKQPRHIVDKPSNPKLLPNIANQSKPRSKVAHQSMIRQVPSDIMVDILAALEGLDTSISGAASLSSDRSDYLTSPTLTERWQFDLDAQLNEFLGEEIAAEEYETRLQTILLHVEKLERSRDLLRTGKADGRVLRAVNGRCREIEEIFERMEKRLAVSTLTG
ncbi:hypothetical protein VTL71DRAFT_3268 [Oculimacula yallundae]|uniref:Uncharacterized protein n=1 Tax=Oculimacula yallundae TaxID=86028 RepID=A0ABR4C6M7_9HELO